MKRVTCLVAGLMLFAVFAAAQAPAAGQKQGLAASLQTAYGTLKGNMTQAAEKMPDANYGFKPGSDPELRTFGQWIGHQADNQFTNCAVMKGVANPSPPQSNEKKTSKAELVKQAEGETARGGVASAMLSHGLESYGIVVVYLRANGIAPPAGGGGRGGRGGQ